MRDCTELWLQISKGIAFSFFPKDVEKERTTLKLLKAIALPPVKMVVMKSIPDVKLLSLLSAAGRLWGCMCHPAIAHHRTNIVRSVGFHFRFLCPVHAPGSLNPQ